MIKLDVWLTFPDGKKSPCGEIVATEPDARGHIEGAFRYTRQYLEHSKTFPLDPVHLPLSPNEYRTDRKEGVHGVFEDALPDAWGRGLLVRKARLPRGRQTVPMLLSVLRDRGLGALSFFQKYQEPEEKSYVAMTDLKNLLDAAYKYDAGQTVEAEHLRLLFKAASSPGGARPKALVRGEDGGNWIAKFPSARDTMAMIPIEAATIRLANKAGLAVPKVEVVRVGERDVLLVKRFDVTGTDGRRHMVSMQTLLDAEGYYNLSYTDLFSVIRLHCTPPSRHLTALFRQMVFNAAIGNTDDHLKNFTVIHDDNGFSLSPAYDLLPDTAGRREHVLYFAYDHLAPSRTTLLGMAEKQGIKKAGEIVDQVVEAVSNWRAEFEGCNVPTADIDQLNWSIERRLNKLLKND